MKVVSPKTLLASLFGIAFVVIKIKTFNGLQDLIWISFVCFWVIKGLVVAFSQKAYDEDLEETNRMKALYCDLFGKFAYIALDIPLVAVFLAGLFVAIFPITTILTVAFGVLLIVAVGYAIWASWYISKYKQRRIEGGEWDSVVLTEKDKRAWKRSDRWHSVAYCFVAILCMLYLLFGDPRIYINNNKLKDALTSLDDDSITLEEVIPFEWTTVYTFDPYTSLDRIKRITGSKSPALKESTSEGMTHIVFKNNGSIVASVCAHPSSTGYSLAFFGGKDTYYGYPDGGYSHIEYGDQIQFAVMKESGLVRLYAVVDE